MTTRRVVPNSDGEGSVGVAGKSWGSVNTKQLVINDKIINAVRQEEDADTDDDQTLVSEKAINDIVETATTTTTVSVGNPLSNGSWQFIISGSDLLIQRRESGTWVTKQTISA